MAPCPNGSAGDAHARGDCAADNYAALDDDLHGTRRSREALLSDVTQLAGEALLEEE